MKQIATTAIILAIGGVVGELLYAAAPGLWDAVTIPFAIAVGIGLLCYAILLRRRRATPFRVWQAAAGALFAGAVAFLRAGSLVGGWFVVAGAALLLWSAHRKRSGEALP